MFSKSIPQDQERELGELRQLRGIASHAQALEDKLKLVCNAKEEADVKIGEQRQVIESQLKKDVQHHFTQVAREDAQMTDCLPSQRWTGSSGTRVK